MVGTQLQLLCGLTGSCPDCSVSPKTVCLALCFGKKSSLCDGIARTIWENVVVQLQSPVWLFVTPWTAARQAPLSFTSPWSLLKFTFIESVGKMWATKFWPRGLVPPDWSLPVRYQVEAGTWPGFVSYTAITHLSTMGFLMIRRISWAQLWSQAGFGGYFPRWLTAWERYLNTRIFPSDAHSVKQVFVRFAPQLSAAPRAIPRNI